MFSQIFISNLFNLLNTDSSSSSYSNITGLLKFNDNIPNNDFESTLYKSPHNVDLYFDSLITCTNSFISAIVLI